MLQDHSYRQSEWCWGLTAKLNATFSSGAMETYSYLKMTRWAEILAFVHSSADISLVFSVLVSQLTLHHSSASSSFSSTHFRMSPALNLYETGFDVLKRAKCLWS